jgi:radical SAM superfamily enzyme YgiQ (UPF0313 family)
VNVKTYKICLVDLGTGSSTALLPLSVGLLSSYISNEFNKSNLIKVEVDIKLFPPESEESFSALLNYDLIGFSTYVWNIENSLFLAKKIKEKNNAIKIVLGGYSIPKPGNGIQEFFHRYKFIDFLVHGEGEKSFYLLVNHLINKTEINDPLFPNAISGMINEKLVEALLGQDRIESLDDIPSPFLNGVFDKVLKDYGDKISGALWETDRGCPFACTFCDWGDSAVQKIKRYDIERLIEEINWMGANRIQYIFNCNANFGILFDRDLEIANHIANAKLKFGYPTFFTTNWTKNSHDKIIQIAKVLSNAGIQGDITLSLQSRNKLTLSAIKRVNLSDEKLIALKKEFHKELIPTYTELILPLPEETVKSIKETLGYLMNFEDHGYFIFYPCSILINTEMASTEYIEKYKIKTIKNIVPVARKLSSAMYVGEQDALVVETSTMNEKDWAEMWILTSFAMTLYNHRVIFYLMKYFALAQKTIKPLQFLEILLNLSREQGNEYPFLSELMNLFNNQIQLIRRGLGVTQVPQDSNELKLTAHECALVKIIFNKNSFYQEICKVLKLVLDKENFIEAVNILGINLALLPDYEPSFGSFNIGVLEKNIFNLTDNHRLTASIRSSGVQFGSKDEFMKSLVKGGRRVPLNQIN